MTTDKMINLAPEECLRDVQNIRSTALEKTHTPETKQFDLLLIGRRDPRTNNSWLHNSYRMVKGKQRCLAFVHPRDAQTRGIANGDKVRVGSRVGIIEITVSLTDDMMPGVVCMPHLWGQNRKNTRQQVANANPGVSMNDITDVTVIDELTGNAIVNGVPVKVEAIDKVSGAQSTPEDETVEEYVA